IRQLIDYGMVYDRDHLEEKKLIEDLLFVSCLNPKSGSFSVDLRLQRHFSLFTMQTPTPDLLRTIYAQILGAHLSQFDQVFHKLTDKLVDATIIVFNKLLRDTTFSPSARKFHYQFNLRELSKVIEGLMMSTPGPYKGAPSKMIKLWVHECKRVFEDRLIGPEDILKFNEYLKEGYRQLIDDDKDNINNLVDQCPQTPEADRPNNVGCGFTQIDDDNDGVPNVLDQCLNTQAQDPVDDAGCLVTAPNFISSNGTFSSGVQKFKTNLPDSTATWNGEAKFIINKASANIWDVQLWHDVALEQDFEYTFCFDAKSDGRRRISVNIDSGEPDYIQAMQNTLTYDLDSIYQHFAIRFSSKIHDASSRTTIQLGGSDVDVQLDNIGLYAGNFCGVPGKEIQTNQGGASILKSDGGFQSGQQGFSANIQTGDSVSWTGEVNFKLNSASVETWQVQLQHEVALVASTQYT
ncbi:MAG: hypothetical protein EOP48_24745, partial [Sphingobacteriales bacterium]